MTLNTTNIQYYNQIKRLSMDDFTTINTCLSEEEQDAMLVYVMDHLDQFNQQVTVLEYKDDYSAIFYWDILNDPVIPYLVKKFKGDFWQEMNESKRHYIAISLDVIDNHPEWTLSIFLYNPYDKTTFSPFFLSE